MSYNSELKKLFDTFLAQVDDRKEVLINVQAPKQNVFPSRPIRPKPFEKLQGYFNLIKAKSQGRIDNSKNEKQMKQRQFAEKINQQMIARKAKQAMKQSENQKEIKESERIAFKEKAQDRQRQSQKYNQKKKQNLLIHPLSKQASVKQEQYRYKRQLQIIDSYNVPTWKVMRDRCHQKNKQKYHMSSNFFIDHQPKKQKANIKSAQQKKNRIEQQKKKQIKKQQQLQQNLQQILLSSSGLQNKEVLKSLNEVQLQQQQFTSVRIRKRVGLDQIVKFYVQDAPKLLKLALSHDYSKAMIKNESKKIPQVFTEELMYKKIFHYLVSNECITDIQNRLKQLQKQSSHNNSSSTVSIKATLNRIFPIGGDKLEFHIKSDSEPLKQMSLSSYRLVLLSNCQSYKKYGINRHQFSILGILNTPTSKEQLLGDVIGYTVTSNLNAHILSSFESSSIYITDLNKVTTHIRQYISITNISHSQLFPYILTPSLQESHSTEFVSNAYQKALQPILKQLQSRFNPTQYLAIRQMALRESGIVLLQGPPGTGKTSTLLGLLSAQYQHLKIVTGYNSKFMVNNKIMVCAPSNAAIDHILKRLLKEGLLDGKGNIVHPRIVRMGIVESLDKDIIQAGLQWKCEQIIEEGTQKRITTVQIKQQLIKLNRLKYNARNKSFNVQSNQKRKNNQINEKNEEEGVYHANNLSLEDINFEIFRHEQMLCELQKRRVVTSRKRYCEVQSSVLDNAQIIVSTLSSSGSQKAAKLKGSIACLIVDEAAQCTQPTLLIALQSGVQKILLIGDPCQLPATCMSQDADVTLLNRSLFERCIDAGIKPYFLNIQYRMCPTIRQFPSAQFYSNRLIDGMIVPQPSQLKKFPCPVLFLDIAYGKQQRMKESFTNFQQINAVVQILRSLPAVSIGVITPYSSQCSLLQKKSKHLAHVTAKTIDSFQGQQKDIIVVSTVRASSKIGFLMDERRVNVMMTRAKHLMILVGHAETLGTNQVWDRFLTWVQSIGGYVKCLEQKDVKYGMQGRNSHGERIKSIQMNKDNRKEQRAYIQKKDFLIQQNTTQNKEYSLLKEKDYNQYNQESIFLNNGRQEDQIKNTMLIEEKRLKQIQAEQFQKAYQKITDIEKQFKKGKVQDDFLKQLFM